MPSRRWVAAVAVVAATAFVVRLAMVLRGAGLGGVFGYDDGVYYSASTSLLWGRMPYRDFLLLHPPGIVLALAPFAALGRLTSDATGFETARVGFMLVGSVNAGLVVVAARRVGLVAATAGGLFYALWVPVALTETTTRLEPLVTLGLLAALAVLANRVGETSRWAQVAAGCALGAAMAVKIWAAAPVAVVLVWCLWRLGPRATARVAAAGAATATAICLPFLLAAPTDMVRMVVLDQLHRPHSPGRTAHRLAGILGFLAWSPAAWCVAAGLTALVVMAAAAPRPLGRAAVGLLVVQVTVLLLAPSYFPFYAAFVAPALALVVAAGVACLRSARLRRVAVLALTGGLAWLLTVVPGTSVGVALPEQQLRPLMASDRCVTSDSPGLLVLLDVLSRDLSRQCRVMVDVSGLTYDTDASRHPGDRPRVRRLHDRAWQHDLGRYLTSGTATLLGRPRADGLSPHTWQRLDRLRLLRRGPGYALLAKTTGPGGLPSSSRTASLTGSGTVSRRYQVQPGERPTRW